MDKLTYLAELAEGLARWVPERERQDILRYYAEYFEEAGPEREAEVVRELGDPWALSCRLAVEGGFVTQEQASSWTPPKKKRWPWILLGAAAVLVFVIGSAVTAVVGLVWRNNVSQPIATTPPPDVAIVDEGTSFAFSSGDSTSYIEGDTIVGDTAEYVEGSWSKGNGSLEVFDTIDAEIGLGNITVVAGDDYTLTVDQNDSLGGYSLKWEVKGGTLKLRDSGKVKQVNVNNWDDFKKLFGAGQYALDVTITVPDGVVLDKIDAKTGLGNVVLWDLAAKRMEAETGMGDVECYNPMQVKKLDLDTGMGDVTLDIDEPYSGVDIDLESGMGNVEASLGCSETECEYELESGMGTVSIDGDSRGGKAERKGNMPYKLDAESGMGGVNVYFKG